MLVRPVIIQDKYDCADTSLYIYNHAMYAATGQVNAYENIMKNGSKLLDIQDIQAGDMFGTANLNNRIINFYNSSGNGQTYNSDNADRSFNSKNIEIGTIGIYAPVAGTSNFSGHVITVTGVTRDSNGNVISIDYIEGHMGNHDQEKHTFTRSYGDYGADSLYNRYSDCTFIGWGEYEP
jgi:hypothetical protein